ncbi:MAG TPA: PLP-dependent aminotransferase family protein [Brevefilum sp.]|nr:PLP-dependent aminotransferase family protein [Brevefilum sp.]HOR19039.1 PLP-dependent aminotransferase family protein [Brevefilum sp.]
MNTLWNDRFASRTDLIGSSAIRELLKITSLPDVISFAGGLPAPEVFPIERFKEAAEVVLTEMGDRALQYGTTEGYQPLREMIAKNASKYGINITADNVLITTGSQQALDLLGKILINRGDRILVESPTYLGALQAWNAYGVKYVTIPYDDDGMQIDLLESRLRRGIKFIYVLPNFQNPTGVTLSRERRIRLVELANAYGVPIIEDDPYGQLRYEGDHIEPVVVLDDQYSSLGEQAYNGNVIYTSTFSKTLAPGLRLAWVIAPPEVITKLVQAKQGADLNTSTLNQFLAYEVANGPWMDTHIKTIRDTYKERRDVMLNALEEYMPEGVHWTRPKGGLFLWVTLPEGLNSSHLFPTAIEKKVAFVPGTSFHPLGGGENTMRLNFSCMRPELIVEGIKRLSEVFKQNL